LRTQELDGFSFDVSIGAKADAGFDLKAKINGRVPEYSDNLCKRRMRSPPVPRIICRDSSAKLMLAMAPVPSVIRSIVASW
jgi:hypothetical protein